MTSEERDKLKAAAAAATPGPWHTADCGPERNIPEVVVYDEPTDWQPICYFDDATNECPAFMWPENRAYIAAADPSSVLSLIADVERLERQLCFARHTIELALDKEATPYDVKAAILTVRDALEASDADA